MQILTNFFDCFSSSSFMPHGYCFLWKPDLIMLHVISDSTIALAYLMIPFALAYFVYKRKDLSFGWMFFCFCAFIFLCGTTHFMEVWTLWHADYWTSGIIKAFTGIVSFITALLLIRLIPTALKLPGQDALKKMNADLEKEVKIRKQALDVIQNDHVELIEKNELLQKANRSKNEFLTNMSHELRTPLNAIIGFSEILDKEINETDNAEHKEYLKYILSSSHHLLQLINDILDLEKISSEKMIFQPKVIDIQHFTEEIINTFKLLIKEKNIQFNLIIDPNLEEINLDPAKLKLIFYNFISNALKFTNDNGKITVRIIPEDNSHFRFEVEDTGIGIQENDLHKLFIEFQQLDAGLSKKYSGTGLGLALTKRIAEAQGGRVDVKSSYGEGSLFYAILPYNFTIQ